MISDMERCLTGSSVAEVKKCAQNMLGNRLVTKQTPPEGVPVNKVRFIDGLVLNRCAPLL
jgi:hypothetical protein